MWSAICGVAGGDGLHTIRARIVDYLGKHMSLMKVHKLLGLQKEVVG